MFEWKKEKDSIREVLGAGPAIDFTDDVRIAVAVNALMVSSCVYLCR